MFPKSMFSGIARFELRYQLKSPVFWVAGILFFLMSFGSVASDNIQIGSTANVHLNSPSAIAQTYLIFCLFFIFAATAFVANVVVRDDETRYGPILRSSRVRKGDYLYGRFIGAFIAVCLCFLWVPLGLILGSAMPWVDHDKLGPFRPDAYVFAYVVLVLPTLFLISAGFFALATATRSMMATYVGVVAVLVLYLLLIALAARPQFRDLVALLEPFGIGAHASATRYWTATERNTLLDPLRGTLLWNRALVVALGAGFLALAFAIFRFEMRPKKIKAPAEAEAEASRPRPSPPPAPAVLKGSALGAQLVARTRLDMGQVFKSPAFFVLLALGLFNSLGGLWFTITSGAYGQDIFPVTRVAINTLRGAFVIIPLIVAIYYAGELVWRERDRNTDAMIDSTPTPDWVFAAPKIAAIILVLGAMLAASVVGAILVQALRGFTDVELDKYVLWYLLPETASAALLGVLAVFMQTLVPHKFVGWALMLVYLVSTLVLSALGFEHNLYQYGGAPNVPLSDMNGEGIAGTARNWFLIYWGFVALALAVLTYGLWRRGADVRLRPRLARLPHRLKGPAGAVMAVAITGAVATGVFIYINTNVWNPYRTRLAEEAWQADYEKALLPYETLAQPKITDVKLDVDLHPETLSARIRGRYVVQNKTSRPLGVIHLRFDRDLKVDALSVEGARPQKTFERFNYRIFAFDTPLRPGERRTLTFDLSRGQRGFRNRANSTRIVANGTFLDSSEIAPIVGMDRTGLLTDRAKRRKYHLAQDLRPPKLEDDSARRFQFFIHGADWVNSDITVSTLADQTPIAPGYKVFDRIEGGRRIAEFKTEAPILDFFSVQSARYAQTHETYKGVDLAIFRHAPHDWNTGRMIRALKVGLDYDQANFSPFQFRQARILEFPDYAQFAQSFANTIPYSEGIGFIADNRDASKIDMVTYVTAHELGHQWWAHQVISADMQGASMLVETFAQYSALMAMKHLYGPDHVRKFLKFELDSYLRGRGAEAVEELPLVRVENQPNIHYRKGSLVMYRLQDELGEATVNAALRQLLKDYAFKAAPYPSSKDFIADLRALIPPERQGLVTDLFEKITLYDLRATHAAARKRPDGRWDVTLDVTAKKLYADGQGKETEAPLSDAFDLALFAKTPANPAFDAKDVIAFKHLAVKSGKQSFTFTVDRKPAFAGLDPYNKAIDRNTDDNVTPVEG